MKKNIAIFGLGYVGMSLATLLSQNHHVTTVDVSQEKIALVNARKSPIKDEYIEKFFAEKNLDLTATPDSESACKNADFVIIAVPTNYDPHKNFFDTSIVQSVIESVTKINPDAVMVIKSTIPVGFTKSMREKFATKNILFSPEFLRESKALYDNLYPSRIIVGTDLNDAAQVEKAQTFLDILHGCSYCSPRCRLIAACSCQSSWSIGALGLFCFNTPVYPAVRGKFTLYNGKVL